MWTLVQEQGFFCKHSCQDALLVRNWILSHDVRWHHWETSRGHVSRKWLQLLNNVKLMRTCCPAREPPLPLDNYTVNGLQLDADGGRDRDVSLRSHLVVYDWYGCRDEYSGCWGVRQVHVVHLRTHVDAPARVYRRIYSMAQNICRYQLRISFTEPIFNNIFLSRRRIQWAFGGGRFTDSLFCPFES